MKNYPNQAADLQRIRRTLEILRTLAESGQRTDDDGVVGYALAVEGAYTFRHLDLTSPDAAKRLTDRITLERTKPAANQGARTNAREMRRTLADLGWIKGSGRPTAEGSAFLAATPGSQEERYLLVEALLQLQVVDIGQNASHPVRVMLDLLAQAPSDHRIGLELALEARDDSQTERDRVRELYARSRDQREASLGASATVINNARKIFPSLARTAGLIIEGPDGIWSLSPDGLAIVASPSEIPSAVLERAGRERRRTRRKVDASTVAQDMGGSPKRSLTDEEQQRAAELLVERTAKHQSTVRLLATLIETPGQLYEDRFSFDLLFEPRDEHAEILLFEVKTLNADDESQCRKAVAQLSWYHFFEVSPFWPGRPVREIAVFDAQLASRYVKYLDEEDVSSLELTAQGELRPLSHPAADVEGLITVAAHF